MDTPHPPLPPIPADVVVVGGGPAGSAAAIALARVGRRVSLIDKASFPRDKCCGDGLTTSALRQLEQLGLDPALLPSWQVITNTVWRSPSGRTIELSLEQNDGVRIATVRRQELDDQLLALARKAGVDVHEETALASLGVEANRVRVQTGTGTEFVCSYVIAADGMWSPTRRLISGEEGEGREDSRYLGEIHAFRQYFTNVTGVAKDRLWVSFEPDLLPGYVWSFPLGDGSVNVGIGAERQPGRSVQWMKQAWESILQRPHVREVLGESAVAEGLHKAWPIPANIQLDLLSAKGGRVLFVGDAARVVDPLTGEGIGQAVESATLASTAIHRYFTDPSIAASRYKRAIRFGIKIDNGFARLLANVVRYEFGARAAIRLAPAGPWKGQYALRWAFEDNPRAGLLTPWRWPARFAKKAGAFK